MAKVGSKEKIRQFLLANIGRIVTSIEIRDAAGAGVSEWARRVSLNRTSTFGARSWLAMRLGILSSLGLWKRPDGAFS